MEQESLANIPTNGDWLLENLVSIVNDSNSKPAVTLLIDGVLLTGELISAKSYFEKWIELSEGAENYISFFKHALDNMIPNESPIYFHMQNTYVIGGARKNLIPDQALWRGKIANVSSFTFGSYEFTPPVAED